MNFDRAGLSLGMRAPTKAIPSAPPSSCSWVVVIWAALIPPLLSAYPVLTLFYFRVRSGFGRFLLFRTPIVAVLFFSNDDGAAPVMTDIWHFLLGFNRFNVAISNNLHETQFLVNYEGRVGILENVILFSIFFEWKCGGPVQQRFWCNSGHLFYDIRFRTKNLFL